MKNFFLVFVILFTTYLDAAQNLYGSFLGNSNWTAGTYKISSDGNEIDLFLEDYIVIDVSPDSTLLLCISAADMSNNALDSIAIYDFDSIRVINSLGRLNMNARFLYDNSILFEENICVGNWDGWACDSAETNLKRYYTYNDVVIDIADRTNSLHQSHRTGHRPASYILSPDKTEIMHTKIDTGDGSFCLYNLQINQSLSIVTPLTDIRDIYWAGDGNIYALFPDTSGSSNTNQLYKVEIDSDSTILTMLTNFDNEEYYRMVSFENGWYSQIQPGQQKIILHDYILHGGSSGGWGPSFDFDSTSFIVKAYDIQQDEVLTLLQDVVIGWGILFQPAWSSDGLTLSLPFYSQLPDGETIIPSGIRNFDFSTNEEWTIELPEEVGILYCLKWFKNEESEPELEVVIDSVCAGGWNSNWMDLGTVLIGDSSECALAVTNSGNSDLIISNIRILEGQNDNSNAAFSVRSDSLVIEPGQQGSIVVYFNPDSAGYFSGWVGFDTNDQSEPTHNEAVHGTGLSYEQEILVETDYQSNNLYYREAQLGDSSYYENIMIYNIGNTALEIDQIVTTEPFYSNVLNAIIDPNESMYISITFLPDSSGIYTGTVTIYSNDSDEGEYVVNLYGYTERTEPGIINIATFGSDDYGNGSVEDPFASISKGLNIAIPNDTILVKNGFYSQTFIWPAIGQLSLIGESMDSTIIDGEANNNTIINNYDINYYPKEISNLTIQNGETPYKGGGINLKMTGEILLKNLIIRDNHADIGGGVYIEGQGSESFIQTIITFENVIMNDNYAEDRGGAVALDGAFISSIMKHVTIANNNAGNVGGGINTGSIGDYAVIVNSIFWNNQPSNINGMVFPYFSNIDVPLGSNNITADPQFLNESEIFLLNENSPCIDAGTDFLEVDLSGFMLPGITPDTIININDQEFYGAAPDMGATETEFILNIENELLPNNYALYQNHPNPFNPITSFRYNLALDGLVKIIIYDLKGRVVKTLVDDYQTAGFKSVQWNATNDRNEPVSAGLYPYTLQIKDFIESKKMILLK